MKKFIAFIFISIVSGAVSQNMVNNPGMEIYSIAPNSSNEVNRASGWSNCNGNYVTQGNWGSPDYLSLQGTGAALLPCGYVACVNPHSGNGVLAFVSYNGFHPIQENI
jgi:hypothetical protein